MEGEYGDHRYRHTRPEDTPISVRRHFTVSNSFDNYFNNRLMHGNSLRERNFMQPHSSALRKVSLPVDNRHQPADGVCAHFLLHGFNRVNKSAINTGKIIIVLKFTVPVLRYSLLKDVGAQMPSV